MISKEQKEIIRKEFVNDLWRQDGFNSMDEVNQKMLKSHLASISLNYANTKEQVLEKLNTLCIGYYFCYNCIKAV